MPPIGETLREARLRQKIDIAEVEAATKIRGKYLRALENEEFDRLPGSTYVRTFLRSYAEFLGLDPHLLVEEYRVRHEPPTIDDPQPLAPAPPKRRRSEGGYRPPSVGGRRPGAAAIVGGALIGLVLLFLVIGLIGGDDEPTDAGVTTAKEAGQGGGRGDGGKDRGADDERSQPADEVKLEIDPLEATYVCIDDGDGERVFEGTLASERSFKGKTLLLNLGRTSVELTANGKPVDLPDSATPVGYEFTPDGEEELPVGQRPCT